MPAPTRAERRRRALLAAGIAVPLVVCFCWVLAPHAHHAAPEPSHLTPAPPPAARVDLPLRESERTLSTRTLAPREQEPVHEPGASDGARPHALTAAHQRIFAENARVAELNGAMDQGDYAALRQLNARYREAYPEDAHALQHGYDLIADCLEELTPARVDAARRFWRERRASSLRRYVRRYCLEGPPASR
jgi:hypothetical protein